MTAAVQFKNVDIIFGENTGEALKMAHAGVDRAEILAKTGAVLGATGANLIVNEGEISVLMGLSGSGKSTLLRAVNGLNQITGGEVLVKDGNRMVVIPQSSGDAVCPVFGPGENKDALEVGGLEQSEQQAKLPALIGNIDTVFDHRSHGARGAYFDTDGIVQGPSSQVGDFRWQRGGEKEGLPLFGTFRDDALHRRKESHIEHSVDFVENKDFDVR